MDRHRFFVDRKTDNIYKYIAEDSETRFHTPNYESDKALPKRKRWSKQKNT